MGIGRGDHGPVIGPGVPARAIAVEHKRHLVHCLLYTSDAADERSSVDLGGRRIIKKKKTTTVKINC